MKLLSNLRKDRKGFTLIEIVIVLAIAALILVIIFLAIAGAQKSQKDNSTVNGVGQVIAAYSTYLSDNDNAAPTAAKPMDSYITSVKDGRGTPPSPVYSGTVPAATSASKTFIYVPGGQCTGATATATTQASQVAVIYYSESKGAGLCKNS